MYDLETKMLLKHYLEQGVSKAELAGRFQLSQRTIHYWIACGQWNRDLGSSPAGHARRATAAHKLDPYKGMIGARLEEVPEQPAQRLYQEVCAGHLIGGRGAPKKC